MNRYRLIPAIWKKEDHKKKNLDPPRILEGSFTSTELKVYNQEGYNIYFFPKY